ncbi:MAG: FxLYD domain-containing protein [Cyanobacteria bacterium J06636_28]
MGRARQQSMEFPMGRDRIIETYIQRLREWKEPPTAERLNALAQEIGLDSDDIATVQQKAQAHFEQGRHHLDTDCLDDAIDELTQATALDPLNLESLQTLTYAYDQRYGKQKNIADKHQAIALANRCQAMSPGNESPVILISSLEHGIDNRQKWFWLVLPILLVGLAFKPLMDMFTTRSAVEQLAQDADRATAPSDPLSAPDSLDPDSSGPSGSEPSASAPETTSPDISANADIPVGFDQPGLTLDLRQSRLENYEDASYYTLQAVLHNTSDQEIDALQLQVEYLDSNGDVFESESTEAIAEANATVRPGDYHAFDLIHKTTPDLAAIYLGVLKLDEVPAPDSYPVGLLIPYTWVSQQPTQFAFDLVARNENVSSYDTTNSTIFDAQWTVTNTGDTDIRQLKLQVNFYNLQNQLTLTEEVLAVGSSTAPMLPGEIRPLRVSKAVDKDYGRYEVMVVEAE